MIYLFGAFICTFVSGWAFARWRAPARDKYAHLPAVRVIPDPRD